MEAALLTTIIQLDIWIMPTGNDHGAELLHRFARNPFATYDQSFTAQSVIDSMLENGYIEDELVAAECREGDIDHMLIENACRMAGLPTDNYGTDLTEFLEDEGKHLVITYYRR